MSTPLCRRSFLVAAGAAVAVGCGVRSGVPAGEPVVGRFASANPGSVNTFWFAAPEGLVVVDAQRTVSDARAAMTALERTGRPVAAIVITHSHPDHVGGLGAWRQRYPQVPVFASGATTAQMRADPGNFYPITHEQLGADFPLPVSLPDHGFAPGATLTVAGRRIETAQFGPGESAVADVYHLPESGTLFCGDLASNRATVALLEGHSCGWLTDLDRLRARFPGARTLHPGHGDPGPAVVLVDEQRRYLRRFRDLVRSALGPNPGRGDLTPQQTATVLDAMNREFPNHPIVASLPILPQLNVAAVGHELAGAGGACCC